MSHLLDTDTCSDVLKRRYAVAERLERTLPGVLHVSAVTLAEARAGALKSPRSAELILAWNHFLLPFIERILPFDRDAAQHYGAIRAELERRGTMLGDRDCMIAAIARHHGLVLVTANVSEFGRVPDLQIENWRA